MSFEMPESEQNAREHAVSEMEMERSLVTRIEALLNEGEHLSDVDVRILQDCQRKLEEGLTLITVRDQGIDTDEIDEQVSLVESYVAERRRDGETVDRTSVTQEKTVEKIETA